MENVSGFSARRLGVVSTLIALVASLLVVPAQQAAFGVTTAAETCSISDSNKTFSGGRGTSSDPYIIASAGNLETLKNCVEAGNANYSATTVHFLQTSDIEWIDDIVIGASKPFRANYDGGGYAIFGFSQSTNTTTYAGLFGQGEDCSVSDLTVSGSVTHAKTTFGAYAGIVMGLSKGCSFENVTVYGEVLGGTHATSTYAGGLLGYGQSSTSANQTEISHVSSHVDITGRSQFGGGLVGRLDNGSITDVDVSPRADARDLNRVRGNITVSVNIARAGGVVGWVDNTTITRATSSVDITGTYTTAAFGLIVGGVVGNLGSGGSVTGSSSSGTLTFNHTVGAVGLIGGLVGDAYSPISESFSTSTIDVFVDSTGRSVGGLVGSARAGVDKSYFAGAIRVDEKSGVDLSQIGGLVGNLIAGGAVTKSYANVTMAGDASWPAGLVGRAQSSTSITDSFAFGTVTALRPSGFVGDNASSVTNSFTFVTVVAGGAGATLSPLRRAGSGVASSVYWNAAKSGASEGFVSGATELTDSQLAIQSSFSGFDFSSTWTMGSCAPYLTWMGSSPAGLCPAVAAEAPTITGITAGDGQLEVAFTAGSDGGATVTDYEYSTTGINDADFVSAGATSSPVTITGLTNGTEYTVRLRAVNSAGESGPSNARNATPARTPAAPSLTTITAGNGQLTLAFTAGSDGGAAISNFKYSTDGSTYTALSPADATTPVTITGLTNGTTYSVTLKAVNSVGDSGASNSLSGTPVAPTLPPSDPSPSPAPASAPAPAPVPEPDSAPRPAAVPTAPASPPVVSPPARPSAPPAPTPPPAADPAPATETSAGPGAVFLRAEEIFEGSITLGTDTKELIVPAFLLQDIAQRLAPDGAPLEEGALVIESGSTMIAVLIIQLGDVRLSAADMGNAIQFTLNIPGFESSSMTVAVQKQALVWAFWIQMGLLGVSAAIAVTMVWLFVARNRRRKNEGGPSGQRMNVTPPPPAMRSGSALGI